MNFLIPIVVILVGFASRSVVELAAELSSNVALDSDAGITTAGTPVTASRIIDMRPEASIVGLDSLGAKVTADGQ